MADKDIGERDVIKEQLRNARVLICLFHTLRSLKRQISCEKMGITSGQRLHCLELLQKMAYAVSEAEYQNWRDIRDELILMNFLNSTNTRLESINGKLKQVVNRHSSLEDFLEKFFIILTTLRTERDHKAALLFQKVKVTPYREDSAHTSRQSEGTGSQTNTHCESGSQTSANLQLQAKFMYKVNVHHACSVGMNCMMCARVYVILTSSTVTLSAGVGLTSITVTLSAGLGLTSSTVTLSAGLSLTSGTLTLGLISDTICGFALMGVIIILCLRTALRDVTFTSKEVVILYNANKCMKVICRAGPYKYL